MTHGDAATALAVPAPTATEARVSRLAGLAEAPMVVSSARPGRSVADFAAEHAAWVKANLHQLGAILFRDFAVEDIDCFDRFMRSVAGPPLPYMHRSSPRTQLKGNIYTSTEYPPEQVIPFHSEMS